MVKLEITRVYETLIPGSSPGRTANFLTMEMKMSWANVIRYFFVVMFLAVLISAILPVFHNPSEGIYFHKLFEEK